MDIQAGDEVLSINGSPIEDIFDYQFLIQDENIDLLLRKPDGGRNGFWRLKRMKMKIWG